MALKLKSFSSLVTGVSGGNYGSMYGARSAGYQPMVTNIHKGGYGRSSGFSRGLTDLDEEKIYLYIGNSLEKYLNLLDELKSYRDSPITKTLLNILRDSLIELFSDEDNLVTIEGDEEGSKYVNQIIKNLDLVSLIKSDLGNFIYYGSQAYHSTFEELDESKESRVTTKAGLDKITNKKGRYNLRYFKEPHKIFSVWKDGEFKNLITFSMEGEMIELNKDEIFILTTNDYTLELNQDFLSYSYKFIEDDLQISTDSKFKENADDLLKSYDERYLAGTPLFESLNNKVKEYILKDYLLSILGIKDLIQPIVLLIGLEKSTTPEDGLDLALEVENLINQNIDMSFMESKALSISELARTLIDNIRVLPDYDGKLSSISELEMDKLSEKIDRLRADQDNLKEDIIHGVGLPIDLFEGRLTKWEAMKTADRFESRLVYLGDSINNSIKNYAKILYDKYPNKKSSGEVKIKVKLVDTDSLSATKNNGRIENLTEQLEKIINLSELVTRTQDSVMIDVEGIKKYVKEQIDQISQSMSSIIDINKKIEESDEGSSFYNKKIKSPNR